MEIQNVPDVLGCGRKRKASGYEYMRSRQESVEGQLHEEKREKAGLLVLLEQEKHNVEELTEQLKGTKVVVEAHERKVEQLGYELIEKSRG
jgi:hypothetical protein